MIRLLVMLLLLSSCGNIPIAYIQNFSSVNSVVFGFKDYEITNKILEDYEYSFIKVRFGRGPHSILILAYVNDEVYEWVGQDDVRIFTKNGRVIKTLGLIHNFEVINSRDAISPSVSDVYETISLYNPDVYAMTMHSSFDLKQVRFNRLEKMVDALRIEENIYVASIGWKETNYYYKNLGSNLIDKATQNIHPRLPVMKIEFYYKF